MFFIPVAFLIFIAFILFLPILFLLGYFQVLTIGFEKLGISPGATTFLLFLILIGSGINIPLTKKKLVYGEELRFFGLFRVPKIRAQGLFINLGGAVVPVLLSVYFLFRVSKAGFDLEPIFLTTILMIIISKFLSRVTPPFRGKGGVSLPALIPPIFSALFALILAPGFTAPCAFISGVLGTLIGADLLNLRGAQRFGGFLSIGGAGVFDGIFLVGMVSALLAGF
ncbi:MAG: hypothetical protein COW72_01940 [Candidatus Nealsonbacteria bacterium CG18_big_fil_WC_8_21_14_2_50_37_10]|uniref:DUF1614 domain-containing protein n=1 Tax=Candidatus Nealsonbacteria bacterium CG18_big_fil_WC_8_21_14_2_50_37_10 TaxID=1974717 RepID=A0A2H0FIH7_9BACT|nr:MAG: hypothetical protein COW72_01940 [Candidatus Nealsonbacteria bacterium CG18_big_fil_WC_8_21_14_2_50_37_10]